jgi:DASH complex subunit DAD1
MEPRSTFEEDKEKLFQKALSGLDQLNSNLNGLNRNLDTINAIGSQFEASSHLWSSFHKAITSADGTKTVPNETMIENHQEVLVDMEPSLGEEQRI